MESRQRIVNLLLKGWLTLGVPRPGDARVLAGEEPDRMQATVASFSSASRMGTVLLDDGTELSFDSASFDASELRLLRPGQRVAIRVDGHRVVAVNLATLPLR